VVGASLIAGLTPSGPSGSADSEDRRRHDGFLGLLRSLDELASIAKHDGRDGGWYLRLCMVDAFLRYTGQAVLVFRALPVPETP